MERDKTVPRHYPVKKKKERNLLKCSHAAGSTVKIAQLL